MQNKPLNYYYRILLHTTTTTTTTTTTATIAAAAATNAEQAAELVGVDDDDDDVDMDDCSCEDTTADLMTAGDNDSSAPCSQLVATAAGQLPHAGIFCRHSSDIFGAFAAVQ